MTMPPPTCRSMPPRSEITPWTDAVLDPKRGIGDEYADEVIACVFQSGSAAAVNGLWATLVSNTGIVPEGLPAPVRDYLVETGSLPEWADRAKLRRAGEIFAQYGAQICMALLCGALPTSYAASKGVQVLGATERM